MNNAIDLPSLQSIELGIPSLQSIELGIQSFGLSLITVIESILLIIMK